MKEEQFYLYLSMIIIDAVLVTAILGMSGSLKKMWWCVPLSMTTYTIFHFLFNFQFMFR